MRKLLNVRVGFSVFLLIVFGYAIYEVKDMVLGAAIFPIVIAGPGFILLLIQLYREIRASLKPERAIMNEMIIDVASDKTTPSKVIYAKAFRFLCWFGGLYLAIYVIGFKLAIPFYFIAFMRMEGKVRWRIIIPTCLVSLYFIYYHFQTLLGVFWPESLLKNSGWFSSLPWLFE